MPRKHRLLLVAGLVFQGTIAIYFYLNLDPAILRLMPDDTFYYLKIAQNMSMGLGSVFSTGEPTNGYHPLWMAALVVIHRLIGPTREFFVLATLMMAVVFNVLAAAVFGRLLKAYGFSANNQLLGVAAYLFLPWMVNLTMTGLETPLFFLCLFTFLLFVQQVLASDQIPSGLMTARLGLAAGLLMLARTDAIVFVAFAWLWILYRRGKAALVPLIVAGMISTIILAPWLIWNLFTFGTIKQSSSSAISALHRYYLPSFLTIGYWRNVGVSFLSLTYWAFVTPFVRHLGGELSFFKTWAVVVLAASLVLVGGSLIRARSAAKDRLPPTLWVPAIGLMVYYFVVRSFIQVWHLSTLYVLAILLSLELASSFPKRIPLTVAVLLMGAGTIYTLQNGYYYPQQELVGSLDNLRLVINTDSSRERVFCATDAGYLGYFSGEEVVNIDGVVNNRASTYIMDGRLSDYLALKQCDVVIMDRNRLEFYDRNLESDSSRSSLP